MSQKHLKRNLCKDRELFSSESTDDDDVKSNKVLNSPQEARVAVVLIPVFNL